MATIYIVDDRPINRQFLVTLLAYAGHRLAEAADGAEALLLVERELPDLIILDIVMPNMDGREFVSRLKADPGTRSIPVIFYTATYRSEEARSIARSCGVDWVLPKPSEPRTILAAVAQALGLEERVAPDPALADGLPTAQDDLNRRMTALSNETLRRGIPPGGGAGAAGNEGQLIQMQAMTLKLVALVEAGLDIGAVRDPARLVELYCRAAQDILTAKYAAICIFDETGGTRFVAMKGIEEKHGARLDWSRPENGALALALKEGRPVRLNGIGADAGRAGLPPEHPAVCSIVVVPLSWPSHSYGFLYVADRLGFEGFCLDDERIAVTIGAQFSLAFENIELCDRVQLQASQLQQETLERLRAVEELRQKERLLIHQSRQAAMGEMINNIAHQWRQPLSTLGLLLQQIAMLYRGDSEGGEKVQVLVENSMKLICHMSRTVDDFRNFFRPDKEKVLFKVNEVLERTLLLIDASLKELGVTLETETQEESEVYGYPNEYAQVLLNILSNARDILAERCTERPRVRIRSFSEEGRAVLTIGDNAGGIPAQIVPKIFDPYFSTKPQEQGTGVGLFMSKTIIETSMQGSLTVRNTAEGAEFMIEVSNGR